MVAVRAAISEVQGTTVPLNVTGLVDRELITGQKSSSDHPIAAELIEALDRRVAIA